jgi:hypothetical protein
MGVEPPGIVDGDPLFGPDPNRVEGHHHSLEHHPSGRPQVQVPERNHPFP